MALNNTSSNYIIVKKHATAGLLLTAFNESLISPGVSVDLYDSNTKAKIDTGVCNNTNITVYTYIKETSKINLSKYREFKDNYNIDIYNALHPAFTTRCFAFTDKLTGFDTTINSRISDYYQGYSASCSNGCEFSDIDSKFYIICKCKGLKSSDVNSIFTSHKIDKYSPNNQEVLLCTGKAFSVTINYLTID
jgi:hypothetical protein